MADGNVADEALQVFLVERLGNQTHARVEPELLTVAEAMPALSWPRCWRAKMPKEG